MSNGSSGARTPYRFLLQTYRMLQPRVKVDFESLNGFWPILGVYEAIRPLTLNAVQWLLLYSSSAWGPVDARFIPKVRPGFGFTHREYPPS